MRQQTQHRHLLGFVRQEIGAAMRHLIVALLVSVVGSAIAIESGAILLTRQAPTLATHITATIVAFALGYATAMTVLFRALLRGIGRGAEWVTNEFEETTRRILHFDGGQTQERTQQVAMGTVVTAAPMPLASERNLARHASTLEDGMLAGIHPE
jgi:hypothetical protein